MKTAIFIFVAVSYILLLIFAYVNWNREEQPADTDVKETTVIANSYVDGNATVTTTTRNYKIPKVISAPLRVSTKTGDYEIDVDGNIRRIR
jgi:hypothetical protein